MISPIDSKEEKLSAKSGSNANDAFAKLSALFPDLQIEELVNMTPAARLQKRKLSDIVEQSRSVREINLKTFFNAINC